MTYGKTLLRFAAGLVSAGILTGHAQAATVAEVMQPFVDNHTTAGAVTMVTGPDKVLNLEAFGYSDLAARKPMRTDNLFWIASMTKSFTATAFMMLVDEGKVNLDDPVQKYLPELTTLWVAAEGDSDHVLLQKPVHPVTIRNLLTHTAGFAMDSPLEMDFQDLFSLQTRVRSYALMPLLFQPGTNYKYSDADIDTVGRIIEVVSGMPYGQFVEQRLLQPLGMKDSTFWPTPEQAARIAKSYKPNAKGTDLEIATHRSSIPLWDKDRPAIPAGGLLSTAPDLARFCQMLLGRGIFQGKRYLSDASFTEMTTPETGNILINGNNLEAYGLGFVVRTQSSAGDPFSDDGLSKGAFGHKGAYKTTMWIDPTKQIALVCLVQLAGGSAGERISPTFMKAATAIYGHQ